MDRPDALTAARDLVAERFPGAEQAWLAGSVTTGAATATSDLDITVLVGNDDEAHRESLTHAGWPVELFVHVDASVRYYVAKDVARRRPTMARLVATGVPLVEGDGGADLRAYCERVLAEGPPPPTPDELAYARYALTDLLDDLRGGGPTEVRTAVAVEVWRSAAELLLTVHDRWSGTGKWLVRELAALDLRERTAYAAELDDALRLALGGTTGPLDEVAGRVLEQAGGPLWSGFRLASDPEALVAPGPGSSSPTAQA